MAGQSKFFNYQGTLDWENITQAKIKVVEYRKNNISNLF